MALTGRSLVLAMCMGQVGNLLATQRRPDARRISFDIGRR
jgi:hypothetical protein